MGLLTDMTVRDQKTKRRINMLKTVAIMVCLVASLFIPPLMDIPYQQGKQFANQTCLFTLNDLRNFNGSLPYTNEIQYNNTGVGNGLEKTP